MTEETSTKQTSGILKYPYDLAPSNDTDYIQFDFWSYKPPFDRGNAGDGEGSLNMDSILGGMNQTNAAAEGIDGNFGVKRDTSIHIYMPQDVSTSYAATWGGKELTNFGAGALSAITNLGQGDFGELFENFMSGLGSTPAMGTTITSVVAKALVNSGGNQLTLNDTLGGTTGIILNPNVEMFYGGPQIRNIGFSFKMSARNEEEAKNIHAICSLFKAESLPAFGGKTNIGADLFGAIVTGLAVGSVAGPVAGGVAGGLSGGSGVAQDKFANFITIPDLVRMQLKKGANKHPYLSQYKALALTNVDINYTPDGSYSTYIGGYPTSVELRIGMVETKIVYKNDMVKDGWSY